MRPRTLATRTLFPAMLAALVVWSLAGLGEPTVLLAAEQAQASPPREKWILHTADTRLAVGVSSDQKLCIYELSGPDGWNWTKVPSVFPLLDRVEVAGTPVTPAWTYRQGNVDKSDGVKLTVVFTCADPALELRSVWQAYEGPGPVHLSMFIVNKSDKTVTIYEQESIDVHVSGPGKDTSAWYINDDGSSPDATGVYHDLLGENYRKDLGISESQDYIPFTVIEAGGARGVYFGWEWSVGRMAISAHNAPAGAHVKAGSGDNFRTDLGRRRDVRGAAGFHGRVPGRPG